MLAHMLAVGADELVRRGKLPRAKRDELLRRGTKELFHRTRKRAARIRTTRL